MFIFRRILLHLHILGIRYHSLWSLYFPWCSFKNCLSKLIPLIILFIIYSFERRIWYCIRAMSLISDNESVFISHDRPITHSLDFWRKWRAIIFIHSSDGSRRILWLIMRKALICRQSQYIHWIFIFFSFFFYHVLLVYMWYLRLICLYWRLIYLFRLLVLLISMIDFISIINLFLFFFICSLIMLILI